MRTRNSSLTGAAPASPTAVNSGLTFPARLIHPPQSQVTRTEDAVTDRITKLDTYAQQLGQSFGISFTSFLLNELNLPDANQGAEAIAYMLRSLLQRDERITLERRGGRWGLYFLREPALVGQKEQRMDPVPLKDAPLDVRERFLLRSEDFFRAYLALCEDRLAKMHDSVASGDRTLALLQNLKLTG